MSKWTDVLSQGRDVTLAAVGYLVPLGPDRLEPMPLPHRAPAPRPPAGQGFRQAVRAVGSVRGSLQLWAGGRGIVARQLANQLATTSYRELRSDQVARRRAVAGRTSAKSVKTRQWLYAGDQSAPSALAAASVSPRATVPTSMANALCATCK